MILDAAKLFPDAAKRVNILQDLRHNWSRIVGPVIASRSIPVCLGVKDLCVVVKDLQTGNMLRRMKGNISRALSISPEDMTLKIEYRHITRKLLPQKTASQGHEVPDEAVNKFLTGKPENLSDDINFALAHLMAFLEQEQSCRNYTHKAKTYTA